MKQLQTLISFSFLAAIVLCLSNIKAVELEIFSETQAIQTYQTLQKIEVEPHWIIEKVYPEDEPYEVEPIEFFYDIQEIDTLLPQVSIVARGGGSCGCQPSYQTVIRIPIDTSDVDEDYSIFAEPIYAQPDFFEAIVYPNPTRNQVTLALDIEEDAQYQITLYDMNGRRIQEIHYGELSFGRNQFEINLNDLKPGMYFVQVIAENQNETLKIQKI
ncbi:MAG: hypothetical protein ACI857_000442 [Arenicella sp.]|jgi:hypothetical protein